MEKDLNKCSNAELVKMMGNLNKNHEKLKEEILTLTDILMSVESEYVRITEILESRGVVN